MTTQRAVSVSWLRIFSEGVVIVASILLALAADAWLGARRDREQERAELEGLRAQLVETRESLGSAIGIDENGMRAVSRLVEMAEASPGARRISVVDSLVRTVGLTTYFDPPLSRFESLIASGRLGLIRDDELRAAIADWPKVATAPQYPANSRREMLRNQLFTHLLADYDVGDWTGPSAGPPTGAMVELPTSRTFTNLLKLRLWIDSLVLSMERRVLTRLEELLALLDEALGT